MGPITTELIEVLNQLVEILESANECHWSEILKKSKLRIEKSDYSGIEMLLGSYGGMGSFNDLIIYQPSGIVEVNFTRDEIIANEELDKLRTKAWDLADNIKRKQ
jgi:hypothetical protein